MLALARLAPRVRAPSLRSLLPALLLLACSLHALTSAMFAFPACVKWRRARSKSKPRRKAYGGSRTRSGRIGQSGPIQKISTTQMQCESRASPHTRFHTPLYMHSPLVRLPDICTDICTASAVGGKSSLLSTGRVRFAHTSSRISSSRMMTTARTMAAVARLTTGRPMRTRMAMASWIARSSRLATHSGPTGCWFTVYTTRSPCSTPRPESPPSATMRSRWESAHA